MLVDAKLVANGRAKETITRESMLFVSKPEESHESTDSDIKINFESLKKAMFAAIVLVSLLSLTLAQTESKCGTQESDYAPCVTRERGDALFKHCCEQYAPAGCQELCQYETDELTARNLLLKSVKSGKCDLKHMSTVLYCASQNQDNRKCCEHLNLADPKLGVGNRCLRFCDPAGEGISSIARTDVTCLFNWNVLMYCHHSGIKAE